MAAPHKCLSGQVIVYVLFALHLAADSWLAYKTTLVTCFGIYLLAIMQVSFKSGRPFWDVSAISSNGYCLYDFAGPSETAFTMTFFWPYVIIMFLFKYYRTTKRVISWILLFLLLVVWVDIYIFTLVNGLDYLY